MNVNVNVEKKKGKTRLYFRFRFIVPKGQTHIEYILTLSYFTFSHGKSKANPINNNAVWVGVVVMTHVSHGVCRMSKMLMCLFHFLLSQPYPKLNPPLIFYFILFYAFMPR